MEIEKAINEFLEERRANLSKGRFVHYELVCKDFLSFNNIKSIEEITDEHLLKFVSYLKSKQWKEWTLYTRLRAFKKFVRWLKEKYGLNLNIALIKVKQVKNNYPVDLISEEEFRKIYINAKEPYKTFFAILYEVGLRPQEAINIKVSDILIGKDGIVRIKVKSGKTGERIVPIIWFARDVIDLYEMKKDNPNAKLFDVGLDAIRKYFKELIKSLGIKKKLRLYSFRHTALTRLAKKVPESILREIAGWTKDSDMPEVYIHLSQRDIEDKLLQAYGIKKEEKEEMKKCPKCNYVNPSMAIYCLNCGVPLSEEILAQSQKEIIEDEKLMREALIWITAFKEFAENYLINNPKMKEKFKEFLNRAHSLKDQPSQS